MGLFRSSAPAETVDTAVNPMANDDRFTYVPIEPLRTVIECATSHHKKLSKGFIESNWFVDRYGPLIDLDGYELTLEDHLAVAETMNAKLSEAIVEMVAAATTIESFDGDHAEAVELVVNTIEDLETTIANLKDEVASLENRLDKIRKLV